LIPESPEEVVMATIAVFSATGGNGLGPSGNGLRLAVFSFLWCFIFLLPAAAHAAQVHAEPSDQGYSPGILPISLGKPQGCPRAMAAAMNSGAYPEALVVAGGIWCGDGTPDLPFQWSQGSWMPLDLPSEVLGYAQGWATSVNDDPGGPPAFVYRLWSGGEYEDFYVVTPGQAPVRLDTLPEAAQFQDAVLSSSGDHVVGGNEISESRSDPTHRAVRWTREADGWSAPQDLAPGIAVATTEDGAVVVGNSDVWAPGYDAGPWVWESNSNGGQITLLEPEASVSDIAHDGSMIVGSRPEPCSDPGKCDFFPAPVYWVQKNSYWVMHDLEALDGVHSIAEAVAVVNGRPIIVGHGFTRQGGILRPVVWIPAEDGTYGPPLRLEALGGHFESWAEAVDVNRNGLVLGWSEPEPYQSPTEIVIWSLYEPPPFQINAGISDAWYNPATSGQGFFINVWESIDTMFIGWFTYDDGGGSGSSSGHYWLTAQGSFSDNRAELGITLTEGGAFDAALPAPTRSPVGTMTVEFSNCLEGIVTYDIPSLDRQGIVPIQRIARDHIANCEHLSAQSRQ